MTLFDSLGFPPLKELLPRIQWFLDGLPESVVKPISVKIAAGYRQSAGSNSCGIAALNFIERRIFPQTAPQWLGSCNSSEQLRKRLLEKLITWHCTAEIAKVHYESSLHFAITDKHVGSLAISWRACPRAAS